MCDYWSGKKVLVTGGAGFVGRHLCEALVLAGADVTSLDTKNMKQIKVLYEPDADLSKVHQVTADLFDRKQCVKCIKNYDLVMHLAAVVGGIGYNIKHPLDIYESNLIITSNVAHAVAVNKIPSILLVSSACVYPGDAAVPTPESEGFRGVPEGTNEGYGWAKRALETTGKLLRQQYGTNVAVVRPFNMYGPGDSFDPERSHVIPALIAKIETNTTGQLELMGNGEQWRSFLYVKDAVQGMMLAAEKSVDAEPINLCGTQEIPVRDLATSIASLCGKQITFTFKDEGNTGYVRRVGYGKRSEALGFKNRWDLVTGLQQTIEYYRRFVV